MRFPKWAKMLGGIAGAIVIALLAWRIASVNQDAEQQRIEVYEMNEWVSFDGAFSGYRLEATEGYSLRVMSASIMTPRQYLECFSKEKPDLTQKLKGTYMDLAVESMDKPSVLVLSVQLKNEGNKEGYMAALNWKAVSVTRPEIALTCDWDLWGYVDESMLEQPSFTINPDSEYETQIPLSEEGSPRYFETFDDVSRIVLQPGKYQLILTNVPVRKIIEVSADYYNEQP